MTELVLLGVALVLLAGAMAASVGALASRSLFVMCMHLTAAGASAAAIIALLGSGGAALAAGLVTVGWTPLLLMSAMLLTTRTAKPGRSGWAWLSAIAALGVLAAVWWPLGELAESRVPLLETPAFAFWLGILLFVTATGCVALLGLGERGALGQSGDA